jgi:hypothetical protein
VIAHANEASVRKNAKRRRPAWCCACTCRRRQRKLDRPRSLHHYHPLLCFCLVCFLFSCSDALRKNLDCENGASAFQAQTGSKAETQRAPCALGSLQTRSSLFAAALTHTHPPKRETFNLLLFRRARSQILLCAPSAEFTFAARRVGVRRTQFAYARAQNYTLSALWRKLMGVACYSGEIRDVSLVPICSRCAHSIMQIFALLLCDERRAFSTRNLMFLLNF